MVVAVVTRPQATALAGLATRRTSRLTKATQAAQARQTVGVVLREVAVLVRWVGLVVILAP